MGVHIFTDRLAFATADWCFRLHGWPIMPPLLGVRDFTAGLPPSSLTGVIAYTVGWSHHYSWASTSSPTGWPSPPPTGVSACTAGLLYAAVVGRPPTGVLVYTVDWSHHRTWASTSSPTDWPSPPPTGVSACTAGLLCRRCWASTTSPSSCLCRCRLVSSSIRIQIQICIKGIHGFKLISYVTGMDQSEHYHRLAVVAADWRPRLYGWVVTPPLLGIVFFTDWPPRPPSTGVFAYTVGWSHHSCWASTSSPPACLRCRRLVSRLNGWHIMPPLLGVYVFTDRLAFAAADWCLACTAGILCRHCWASTSSPTGSSSPPPNCVSACMAGLLCRRLLGDYVFTDQFAFAAADWCLRLHGWPIMPLLLGVYVFTAGSPSSPLTGVSACMAGLLCRRYWASTSSLPARLRRRRLVSPPAQLVYYAAVVGRLHLLRPATLYDANWCYRLHSWPRRSHRK
uniref:cysteine dioxygenase n=1 Tax=Oryza sativa subsp. japonica TaxID=39947 RepID=Q2QV03_ORYSJ|nr:hypothetical protein LOC_Os12g14490 [Oryza sativa Japonica Group]